MKYLGIDYGTKRVGISVSDDGGKIAFAREVFANDKKITERIKKLFQEEKIEAIILGESKNFAGEDNAVMADINIFAENLKKELSIPIYLEPEFMTSLQAAQIQGDVEKLDASAAAIILQSYIDKKVSQKADIGNQKTNPEQKSKIPYDDFAKVEIKVGKVLTAEKIPNTDKLLKLTVDFGEAIPRQIVSGIALYFQNPLQLVGRNCLFVTNLEPRVIKGYESNGMILALSTPEGAFSLLEPNKEIPIGTKVK